MAALTKLQKILIAGVVIVFVLLVLTLVFGILAWLEAHTHTTTYEIGPGLLGFSNYKEKPAHGSQMAMYRPSGKKVSDYLLPRSTLSQENTVAWAKGRTDYEVVSLQLTRDQPNAHMMILDLRKQTNEIQVVRLGNSLTDIDYGFSFHDGRTYSMYRSAICWDARRNRWLACMYSHVSDTYELVAFDDETLQDKLVPLVVGGGVDRGTYGGCLSICVCGTRLFTSQSIYVHPNTVGTLFEWDCCEGRILGSYNWEAGPYLPITNSTLSFVQNKEMLDGMLAIAYDEDNRRVFFVIGGELRIFAWVLLDEISSPLTAGFQLNVASLPCEDYLNGLVWIPKLEINKPRLNLYAPYP